MRLLFTFIIFFSTVLSALSQAPQGISYQAIARNASGEIYANQNVAFQLSILQGSSTGTAVYVETHSVTTNDFGVANLVIGQGSATSGTFSAISWGTDSYFLQVELDVTGGTSYTNMGTTQLLSVPYALHAGSVANVNDADADPTNETISSLNLNGNTLEINEAGNLNTVDLSSLANDNDADSTNETISSLNLNGNTLEINEAGSLNTVDLSNLVNDNDADSTNETISSLNLNGNTLEINEAGSLNTVDLSNLVNDNDADSTNETISSLNLNGNTLEINEAGSLNTVDLTNLVNDNDADTTNETISSLNLNGNTLEINEAGSLNTVDLTNLVNDNDADSTNETISSLNLNGTVLEINEAGNLNTVDLNSLSNATDADSTNEIISSLNLNGTVLEINEAGNLNTVDLNSITNNNDADSTNEIISSLNLNGTVLEINEAGNLNTVDLNSLSNATDADSTNELISSSSLSGDTLIIEEAGNTFKTNLSTFKSNWTKSGNNIYYVNGRVGIGSTSPNAKLDVIDTVGGGNTGAYIRLKRLSSSNSNIGMNLILEGDGPVNRTLQLSSNQSNSNTNNSIYGTATNANENTAAMFYAGLGQASLSAGQSLGLFAQGANSSSYNTGVYGDVNGTATNENIGVFGTVNTNSGNPNYGVYGYTIASGSGNNYGVFGQASGSSSNNYAGYFQGDVTVTGDLNVTGSISKGSGTFKIDHPADPENKYLVHSFVESPDMMNVYNGNITTDANGFATVDLPDYVEISNKEFRYQLTVIGQFAQAIVKEKINGNKFIIQTNIPNVEVSWQLTGIRNDPYAKQNRIQAEQEKPAAKKGTYLHPKAYKQSKEQGENYQDAIKNAPPKPTIK